MKKQIFTVMVLLLVIFSVAPLFAAQTRIYVGEMNVVGAQNKDEIKPVLQTLLASRLNSDSIVAVGSITEADAVVTGTYITIGKTFSLDALVKTTSGKTLTRAFVQGESQDELIPSVGKLAEKLSAEIAKVNVPLQSVPAAKNDFIKNNQQVQVAPTGEFIKPRDKEEAATSGWVSKRLEGVANLIATGRSLADGSREVFLAEAHKLAFYRQGTEMKLVAETSFRHTEKIVSLDTVENSDSSLDVYVTIVRNDDLNSQVWQVKDDKLIKVAENLPYFFRSFALGGAQKKLYAQSMGRDVDFYGEVFEVTRSGSEVTLKNPIKMPRYADIYSFNQFRDREGKLMTLAINPDNYIVVYDQDLKELWRSNDKFGGSELFFQKADADVRTTGDKNRWIFMNQRIQVTSKGEILIGKNDGFWVLGNSRSYKRGAVYNLTWNGSSLEEKWRTRDTQNYMPDYFYDEARNELLILQTVQRSGFSSNGASSLSIKKVE